jgi:hypothetical protein
MRVMAMTRGSVASSDESRRRIRNLWRRFIDIVIGEEAAQVEHEIIEYLERHQHDLPPELRIILERRFLGP